MKVSGQLNNGKEEMFILGIPLAEQERFAEYLTEARVCLAAHRTKSPRQSAILDLLGAIAKVVRQNGGEEEVAL